MDLRSKEHGKTVDWIMNRVQYSAAAKKEVEKEAMRAFRHLTSTLDEKKHPFPVKIYDPVYYSSEASKQATFADALFTDPPLMDYMPGQNTSWQQATDLASVIQWHEERTGLRGPVLDGTLGQSMVGTQLWGSFWDYEETYRYYWQRVPMAVNVLNPITMQPEKIFVPEGDKWKYVRSLEITRDHPNMRPIPITSAFLDDTDMDIQKSEWVIVRDEISGRTAKNRVKWDKWDPRAVELARKGQAPAGWTWGDSLTGQLDWMQDIGLRTSGSRDMMGGVSNTGDAELNTIEVLECWRKWKGGIQRIVLLNRAWIAWFGWSPYGHGLYPFALSRNFRLPGQFWGLSNYRIVRWLIRGIQVFRNAAATEALHAAMPPLLLPADANIIGKRWGPGVEWYLENCSPQEIQWLQATGAASNIAGNQADQLQGRLDVAIGSSDPARGGMSEDASRAKATTMSIMQEAAGTRNTMSVENFGAECVVPMGFQFEGMTQQNQDYGVQCRITGNPKGDPITIYPEQFRGGEFIPVAPAALSPLKAQNKKQWMDLYQLAAEHQEPNANRRALWEGVVTSVAPAERDAVMAPLEQTQAGLQQQGIPPMQGMQQQGPPGGGGGAPPLPPPGAPPRDNMAMAAQQLTQAYGR